MQGKLYQEAEQYIKDIFWNETHDKNSTLNLPEIINARLIKDNEEKDPDYYQHREAVVHVSSLSKCLRGVVYEMLGAKKDGEIDPRKLGVFKAGNLFEDFIVDALGDKMLNRQTEYVYKYKGLILTGRDDGTIEYGNNHYVLEAKSVHSDSFWYRQQEGTLIASHNQMQLQTYLWLRRVCNNVFVWSEDDIFEYSTDKKPVVKIAYTNLSKQEFADQMELDIDVLDEVSDVDESNLNGIFSYISKDDCTVISAPVKFNQNIIDNTVIPALDIIAEAYAAKDPKLAPVPELATYSETKNQWQKNWLCTYCEYHCSCAGNGWVLEASNLVSQKNRDNKVNLHMYAHTAKKVAPTITVEPAN